MKLPRIARSLGFLALWSALAAGPARAEEEPVPFPAEAPGAVLAPDSGPPKLVIRVAAVWPAAVQRPAGEVGVYVAFVVTPEGRVKNPRALFGRFPDFEPAAVEAVAQWRFTPGRHEGHPVTTQMIGRVTFEPPDRQP